MYSRYRARLVMGDVVAATSTLKRFLQRPEYQAREKKAQDATWRYNRLSLCINTIKTTYDVFEHGLTYVRVKVLTNTRLELANEKLESSHTCCERPDLLPVSFRRWGLKRELLTYFQRSEDEFEE